MHDDLEGIVSADEEARARVASAEEWREREIGAAKAARDEAIDARRRAVLDAFESELRAIREDGDRRVRELQAQQAHYLGTLANAGEQRFDEAVATYVRIVGGGAH